MTHPHTFSRRRCLQLATATLASASGLPWARAQGAAAPSELARIIVGPPPGTLVDAVRAAIADETGLATELSTTGGTSDGRFIARVCPQVIELGPPNATIHKVDEHVAVADIEPLKNIYRRTLERLNAAPQA